MREGGGFIYILYMILAFSCHLDLTSGRIPNFFVLIGFVYGFFYRLVICDDRHFLLILLGVCLPLVVLFPLYLIRGMGAGDIKLFSMIGLYVSLKDLFIVFAVAVFIGAVLGIFKLIYFGGVRKRIAYIKNLIENVICMGGKDIMQGDVIQMKDYPKEAVIHFSVPIFAAAVIALARHYVIYFGGL